MSGFRTSEVRYALFVFTIATFWASASFVEHNYFKWMFVHTPTSGLLLSAGARMFLLLAFRWRGAVAVSVLMIAYKFHDGSVVDVATQSLVTGMLWGMIPYLLMELASKLLKTGPDLKTLKQKHLFLYAWAESFAVLILTVVEANLYTKDLGATAIGVTGAVAAMANFLGVVLFISISFFAIKFSKRGS